MKILVTGAGGYIGIPLVELLLKKNYKVIALDRFFFGKELLINQLKIKNLKFKILQDDIRWVEEKIFKNSDAVIDLAALSNDPAGEINHQLTKDINFYGRLRIAKLAKKYNVKKYILGSTCSVYGKAKNFTVDENSKLNPLTAYSKSIADLEKEVLKLSSENFCTVILRQATVYGLSPRMRFDLVLNIMVLNATLNQEIKINGDGKQWRPLISINDICSSFVKFLETSQEKINSEIFNVGSDTQNYQIINLAKLIQKQIPEKIKLKFLPATEKYSADYKVSFAKIKNILNFQTQNFPKDEILKIYSALKTGKIIFSEKNITVKWYKYLIEAEKILREVKVKEKLFY